MRKLTILLILLLATPTLCAGELVRLVRNKISAGDIASGQHLVEDYKNKTGVDAEYLDAIGWLARGAEMLQQNELAASYVAELRREIRDEKEDWLSPLGAAIEVDGKLRAKRDGRGAALQFLEDEFTHAKNIGLRSRIRKNINALSLEGQPVLLFLWAHWCDDCRTQAAALGRVWKKYQARGLVVMAPMRLYGTTRLSEAELSCRIEEVLAEK